TFFYTSPTVGETLAIIAFVTVAFGGFGSVPGALVAGLIIGVLEALSAYWIGPVYKDVIVYTLFVLVLWTRPQGLIRHHACDRRAHHGSDHVARRSRARVLSGPGDRARHIARSNEQ